MGKEDERILVIPRDKIFLNGSWEGICRSGVEEVMRLASTKGEFKRRGEVEENPSLKQIIPYIIFQCGDRFLLMQKKGTHTEQRLANLYSFGIGGHLLKEDLQEGEDILAWARREFIEEVDYEGLLNLEIIGLLNDDSNPVGKAHLGVVIIARGDTPQIEFKDKHGSDEWVTPREASMRFNQMERWSRIILDYLQQS